MANTDNECAHLEIGNLTSKDFDDVVNIQSKLQEKIGTDFSKMKLYEIAVFWMSNAHAENDEFGEMIDALGGINDGIGNGVWKWWKQDNKKAKNMTINDLSEKDLLELKFEIVDKFHFFLNYMVSIGMTGSELFNMYMSKNSENFNRQENGY